MADDALGEQALAAEEIAATLTVSASAFSRVLAKGLRHAVTEGYTLDRVLRQAALSVSAAGLAQGLRPLTNLVGQGANGLFGGLVSGLGRGGAAAAQPATPGPQNLVPTKVMPFAQGGVIGAPTMFGMAGGRVGLMGEAGREAVLPLARGPDGRLGVALEGQGGGGAAGTTINVSIATSDVDGFQRSEAQVTAMLARAVARGRRGL